MSDAAVLYNDCSYSGQAFLPNTTASPICGVRSNKNGSISAIASSCCEGVTNYGCWSSCLYINGIQDFMQCLTDNNATNSTLDSAFCFGNITNQHFTYASKSESPDRRAAPTFSVLLLVMLLASFFVAPTDARIIPSLGDSVEKRADDGCEVNVFGNFTTIRNIQLVSAHFPCDVERCLNTINVDTGINNNNRTINSTSAADPAYNAFFSMLQDATHRTFPAQSSVEAQYSFVMGPASDYYLGWTAYAWCANGTTSGCGSAFGDSKTPAPFLACGPMFADDAGNEIQGILHPVTTV